MQYTVVSMRPYHLAESCHSSGGVCFLVVCAKNTGTSKTSAGTTSSLVSLHHLQREVVRI